MDSKRFEIIYTQGKLDFFKIVRDNETGVLYLLNLNAAGSGLTVLVDQEGKPLVDDEWVTYSIGKGFFRNGHNSYAWNCVFLCIIFKSGMAFLKDIAKQKNELCQKDSSINSNGTLNNNIFSKWFILHNRR